MRLILNPYSGNGSKTGETTSHHNIILSKQEVYRKIATYL